MTANTVFCSKLGVLMTGFIKEKRSMGFCYDTEERLLAQFDRFTVSNGFDDGIVSRELVSEFSKQLPTENMNYRNKRVTAVRQFAFYLLSLDIDAYIPGSGGSTEKTIPYLMDDEELREFFSCVDKYLPARRQDQGFAMMYPLLYRLIYCCGLRISEACNLRREDVDLLAGIVRLLHSKGDKDRVVYLAEDLRQLFSSYDSKINDLFPSRIWVFPGKKKKPLPITTADMKFKYFWNQIPGTASKGKSPTVHGFRHLFVVNTINKWIRDGEDVDSKLPYLCKYLGHSSAPETLYYYHQVVSSGSLTHNKDSIRARVIPEVMCYEN